MASDFVLVEVSPDFRLVSGLWICFAINPDLQISETMFSETHSVWMLISDPSSVHTRRRGPKDQVSPGLIINRFVDGPMSPGLRISFPFSSMRL